MKIHRNHDDDPHQRNLVQNVSLKKKENINLELVVEIDQQQECMVLKYFEDD